MYEKTVDDFAAIADPVERARSISRAVADQQNLIAELARLRRAAIAEARAAGVRQDAIARSLGVSAGRVSQMTAAGARDIVDAVDGTEGPPTAPEGTGRERPDTEDVPSEAGEPLGGLPGGPEGPCKGSGRSGVPRVLVRRALPTEPAVRGSASLFLTEAAEQGVRPSRRMLYVGPERAADHVAAALRVEPGAEVLARRKLLLADEVPVRIATSYFRLDVFGGTPICDPGFVRPTLQAGIEALGHRFGHAEEHLVARPPTGFEAETLWLEPGEWVVQVLRAGYGDDGTPVHTLETICAASRHVFPIGQVAGADEF